jgi:rod shape-determining protein MreD
MEGRSSEANLTRHLLVTIGAVLAALIETSVLPEVKITGVKPDLVFVLAIIVTMTVGLEDGTLWAFLGGLTLDLLLPDRTTGVTTLSLIVVVGVAAVVARVSGQSRVAAPVVMVFLLSFVYQMLVTLLLIATAGIRLPDLVLPTVLRIAVLDAMLALAIAIPARRVWLRFGQPERAPW